MEWIRLRGKRTFCSPLSLRKKVDLEKNLLQEELSCLINVLSQHSSSQKPELRKKLKFSLETISRGIIKSLRVSESPSLLKRIQYLESSWRGAMLLSKATGDESYLENFLSNLKESILGEKNENRRTNPDSKEPLDTNHDPLGWVGSESTRKTIRISKVI